MSLADYLNICSYLYYIGTGKLWWIRQWGIFRNSMYLSTINTTHVCHIVQVVLYSQTLSFAQVVMVAAVDKVPILKLETRMGVAMLCTST